MRGEQSIELYGRNLHYYISLKRNITILQGNSGIGKTTLYEKINECNTRKGSTRFSMKSSAPVYALSGNYTLDNAAVSTIRNSIFVIDEGAEYLNTQLLASMILGSSNYFLIISRHPLPMLPYSYHSIYTLETRFESDTYITEMREVFSNGNVTSIDSIITEDSNSGRQMFKACYNIVEDTELTGNSNLATEIEKRDANTSILVFADGAALGPYINLLSELIHTRNNKMVLWAPESFEYVLLTSGIVYRGDVQKILESPENEIESSLFKSWEVFFTWLVKDIMSKYPNREYSKNRLKDWYISEENKNKFIAAIPTEIRKLLENTKER